MSRKVMKLSAFALLIIMLLSSCSETIQTISPTSEPSETVAETVTAIKTETSVPEPTPKKLPSMYDVYHASMAGNTLNDVFEIMGECEDYVFSYSYVWYFWTIDTGENVAIWFEHNNDYTNFENWVLIRYTVSETVSYDEAVAFDNDTVKLTVKQLDEEFGDCLYSFNDAYVWRLDNGKFLRFCNSYYRGITEEDTWKYFLQIVDRIPHEKTLNVKEGMTFQEALDILGYTGTYYSTNFFTEYAWELDNGQLFKIHFDHPMPKKDSVIAEVTYIGIPKE